MPQSTAPGTLTDYLTGRPVSNVGPEANRQAVIRYLLEKAGYDVGEIAARVPIAVSIDETPYRSIVDLVISLDRIPLMLIKCAAGSLGSREREALAAARLLHTPPLPLVVVSDGRQATVLATARGRKLAASDLSAIPRRRDLVSLAAAHPTIELSDAQRHKESLIFRSYDSMEVNVAGRG